MSTPGCLAALLLFVLGFALQEPRGSVERHRWLCTFRAMVIVVIGGSIATMVVHHRPLSLTDVFDVLHWGPAGLGISFGMVKMQNAKTAKATIKGLGILILTYAYIALFPIAVLSQ